MDQKIRNEDGTIRFSRIGEKNNIALFTLDRASKANAYTPEMMDCFQKNLSKAITDKNIKAAIVTGAGSKVFCSGADISSLSARSYEDGMDLLSRNVFTQWAQAPWPTIAAITGPAIAGGLELALASDLRICTPSSWFAFPEIELGLIPAAGGITRLGQVIGTARAKEVILFGKKIDARLAYEWGLVSQISDQALEEALIIAEQSIQQDALVMRLAKTALNAPQENPTQQTLEAVTQALLYKRRSLKKSNT